MNTLQREGNKEGEKRYKGAGCFMFTNSFMEITAARKLARSGQGVTLHCGFFDYLYHWLLAHSKMYTNNG